MGHVWARLRRDHGTRKVTIMKLPAENDLAQLGQDAPADKNRPRRRS